MPQLAQMQLAQISSEQSCPTLDDDDDYVVDLHPRHTCITCALGRSVSVLLQSHQTPPVLIGLVQIFHTVHPGCGP